MNENTNTVNTDNTVVVAATTTPAAPTVDATVPATPATPVVVPAKKKKAKSMKGVKGTVGAPEKPTNWPDRPFTTAVLFARNPKQCQLGLRNKVKKGLRNGTILALATKKQPNGGVGRPKSVFVLTQYFDPATMVLVGSPVPAESVVPVAEVSPAPVQTEPVVESAATSVVVMEVPAAPVENPAVVETPAESVAAV